MGVSCTSVHSFWTKVSLETTPFTSHISTLTSPADKDFIQIMIAWPAVIKTQGPPPAAMAAKLWDRCQWGGTWFIRDQSPEKMGVSRPKAHLNISVRAVVFIRRGGSRAEGPRAGVGKFCTSRPAQPIPVRTSDRPGSGLVCVLLAFVIPLQAEGQQGPRSRGDWRRESVFWSWFLRFLWKRVLYKLHVSQGSTYRNNVKRVVGWVTQVLKTEPLGAKGRRIQQRE